MIPPYGRVGPCQTAQASALGTLISWLSSSRTSPPDMLSCLRQRTGKTRPLWHSDVRAALKAAHRAQPPYPQRTGRGLRELRRRPAGKRTSMSNLPTLDDTIFASIDKAERQIEGKLDADVVFISAELRGWLINPLRNRIEKLVARPDRHGALAVVLTTPGGEAESTEKMVEIFRHHYPDNVYFIVPSYAFSAGTILCMSGDRIYMDYSSALGPIDPQVPDREGKYLVPALGYLDKVEQLVEKSRLGTITPAELAILVRQDLAMLRSYEQAKDLSVTLTREWLCKYKFKKWEKHRTTNPGSPVTPEQKKARAHDIADKLSSNKEWHSHGRMIGINTLRNLLRLDIEDYGTDKELSGPIRLYSDTLNDYISRQDIDHFIYNQRVGL
jgi:hypothetical protein